MSDRIFALLMTVAALISGAFVASMKWEPVHSGTATHAVVWWLTFNGKRVAGVALTVLISAVAIYYWRRLYRSS